MNMGQIPEGQEYLAPVEPNYEQIGLNDEQQSQVVQQIEELWPQMVSSPGALQMNREETLDLLKNVAQDLNIEDEVYEKYFVDVDTSQPLDAVSKEQMHLHCIQYLSDFEKQKARTQYEAQKQLYDMQMQQQFDQQRAQNRQSWSQIAAQIPSSKNDPQHIQIREEIWGQFDVQSKGNISMDEAQAGVRDVLKIQDYLEIKPAIDLAFIAAKNSVPNSSSGPDAIDK